MKKLLSILLVALTVLLTGVSAYGDDGKVTYQGGAEEFIFEPGSKNSPTDIFPDLKDVMPGDSLTQRVKVRNERSKEVKVNIYLRALGAQEGSEDFLSQLLLTITEKKDTVMFKAQAHETAGLTDWVLLGTLYSGGEAELLVTLDVPVTLGNEYKNQVGLLDWEFKVEEMPVEPDDPPVTGEHTVLWILLAVVSFVLLFLLILLLRRRRSDEERSGDE